MNRRQVSDVIRQELHRGAIKSFRRGLPHPIRLVAGRARRTTLVRLHERSIAPRMLWILGSPRSGSTWLLKLLRGHPSVVAINEPLIGWYLGPFLSDMPGGKAERLDTSNFTLRREQRHKADQFFATQFEDVWRPDLARMIRRRFAAHAIRFPPPDGGVSRAIIAIKEPNGSQSADEIMRALPQARFLFLLRDGRDVVDSELAAHLKDAWLSKAFPGAGGIEPDARLEFVGQSARKWLWRTEVVQAAFAEHPGPRRLIRYEELLADPAAHLRSLFAWLGIAANQDLVQTTVDRHAFERLPEAHRGPLGFYRSASPGSWRENLSEPEQAELARILHPKLRELGYLE